MVNRQIIFDKLPLLLPPCIIAATASRSIPGKEFDVRDNDDLAEFDSPPPVAAFTLNPKTISSNGQFSIVIEVNRSK